MIHPLPSWSWQPLRPVRIQPHGRFTLPDPKSRQSSRVSYNRHRRLSFPSLARKVPRVPLDRRRHGRDLRVERHRARREGWALAKCGERVHEPEASDPEERRAQRDAYLPRSALLLSSPTSACMHSVSQSVSRGGVTMGVLAP